MACLNDIKCFVEKYQVQVETGAVGGTIQFSMVPDCHRLKDPCRIKAVLLAVADFWIASKAGDPLVDQACCDRCHQRLANSDFVYYGDIKALVFTTALTEASPVVYDFDMPGCVVTLVV